MSIRASNPKRKSMGRPILDILDYFSGHTGLVSALFLAVSLPRMPPRGRHETLKMLERIKQEKKLEQITYSTLSLSFWILLAALIAVIIIRYLIM